MTTENVTVNVSETGVDVDLVNGFVEDWNTVRSANGLSPVSLVSDGYRYYRVVDGENRVLAFVSKVDGTIYRPASQVAPATKYPRGSVNDNDAINMIDPATGEIPSLPRGRPRRTPVEDTTVQTPENVA